MDPTKMAKVGGGVSGLGLIVFLIQQLVSISSTQATVVEAVNTIKQDVKALKIENAVMRDRMIEMLAAQRHVHGQFPIPFGEHLAAEAEVAESEAAAASPAPPPARPR